jgi:hypothetical protein
MSYIFTFLTCGLIGILGLAAINYVNDKRESKNARTQSTLVGRIICLHAETPQNTWREIVIGEYPRDFIATINVSVTNESTLAATATRFELSLIFNDKVHSCTELPIPTGRSFLKRTTRMPGGGGPRKITWETLNTFSLNTEISNTTHQTGWLKFWTGPIQDLRLDTAKIRLIVFDHRNQSHTIYDGPVTQPSACGTIVEGQARETLPEWE